MEMYALLPLTKITITYKCYQVTIDIRYWYKLVRRGELMHKLSIVF